MLARNVPVVVADRDGGFVMFNPAAERILGLGMTDIPKERWAEIYGVYHPDRVTPFPWNDMPLARALVGKETRETKMFIRHPTIPEGVYISVTGTPLMTTCDLCVQVICSADPYCCSTSWDNMCVSQVTTVCGLSC